MNRQHAGTRTIAIIGGGVSGALTAYHLLRQNVDARVIVIEPRAKLGLGLAYSTPSLQHLLNVPASKISALPDQPNHFLQWLRANYDAHAEPGSFAPRAVFGDYVRSLIEDLQLEQEPASVVDYQATDTGATLQLENGRTIHADFVVLATGNFDPAALPGISEEAVRTGAYCHNVWAPDTYRDLDPDAPVALIGSGLTAVDVVLRLRELGHRGSITAISRHGVLPNRHAAYEPIAEPAVPAGSQPTCVAYLRAFRARMRSGIEWRAAIDSLRATTNDLWLALPLPEQKRFRRHLQRRWDILRHRMAPTNADLIDAELEAGMLLLRNGHVLAVKAHADGAIVTLRTPGGEQQFVAARVMNCTGPGMNYRNVGSPLLNSLFDRGVISAGPLGGGFRCSHTGAMLHADGQVSGRLFNLGPGRLGTLLESIAIPEIRQQAVHLAAVLGARLRDAQHIDTLTSSNDSGIRVPRAHLAVVAP